MTDESNAPNAREDAPESRGRDGGVRTPMVFITDPAAESARIADRLRTAGYVVVDVPLSMLVARAQVQRPNVVLLDADAVAARAEVARLRRLPGAGAIDFVYFGSGEGPIKNEEDATLNDGSAFFLRPVDADALVRRVEALTGGPGTATATRSSIPPPPSRIGSTPPERPSTTSLPAPGLRTPGPPLPMSVPSLADLVDPPRSFAAFGTVSNELQQLLAAAELRVDLSSQHDAPLPSPEEEIEAVLPADVLASLDESIEDEDEEFEPRAAGGDRDGTGHGKPTTAGGSKHTTSSGRSPSGTPHTLERPVVERLTDEPAVRDASTRDRSRASQRWSPPGSIERSPFPPEVGVATRSDRSRAESVTASSEGRTGDAAPDSRVVREVVDASMRAPEAPRGGGGVAPVVVPRAVDARRFLGEAIAHRLSGAICFEHDGVVRRLVVREGDFVTAASGAEQESLVCFLGARGELPRDEVERLAGKVPPHGRHGGAALVAHGWLGQERLWNVLRAHAEWIATCVLRLEHGTAQLEVEPPGRLRSEPSVFAASTGAEIFVELVRRAVSPEEAIEALGGEGSRIGDGPAHGLLSECALPPIELELVGRARGGTLGELLARAVDGEIASVVHALALLGVLDVLPSPAESRPALGGTADLEVAALDDEAIRARVRARLELVEEGDYFSVLGVARDATGYEVRRAFAELRRAFEPTRLLSPRLIDLTGDVQKIVVVLEEAYEILRDVARRERYRKAIDARPS